MPKIVLTHVTKQWGKFIGVNDLNLEIEDGSFVTLLGSSGCGKTTTLRMIAGLETPTKGEIRFDDKIMFSSEKNINVPAAKREVGFLFQNYALWPHMTVTQNIAFGLETLKWKKSDISARVQEMLKTMRIEQFADRYPAELSGGQQQRVAIARTLAPKPRVLFMDEPLSNLDAKLRLEMRSELQRLHLTTGSTFVYVTHDQMEAMTLATRICLIDNGRLQQYDEPLTVYNRPNNLFVGDFVGNPSINYIEASGKEGQDGLALRFFDGQTGSFHIAGGQTVASWYQENDRLEAEEKRLAEEAKKLPGYVEKTNKDVPFPYHIARVEEPEVEKRPAPGREDFVIGVRPEFIRIDPNGAIEGEVFSAMPTGMETTLKIRVGAYLLTAVVFGGMVYKIGQKVRLSFSGENIMLFSRQNGKRIANGSFTV